VRMASRLDGMRSDELTALGSLAIIAHASKDKEMRLHPQEQFTIRSGDKLVVSVKRELCAQLVAWSNHA